MTWRRLSIFRFQVRGRGGSWLAILGQMIALVGLPLPRASAKDLSKPFPCQHRACGCMSQSDCYKSCCCFSVGDRVAWAVEHDQTPPQELVEEAAQEAVCCEHDKNKTGSHGGSCCQHKHSDPSSGSRWFLAFEATRCHGSPSGLTEAGPAIAPSIPVEWSFEWSPAGSVTACDMQVHEFDSPPLLPPPRV